MMIGRPESGEKEEMSGGKGEWEKEGREEEK